MNKDADMKLLDQLFSAKHLQMQRETIHKKYDDHYKKQGEYHRAWLATFYTRAKRFPSPLMPAHTFDRWEELRKNENPSCEVVCWLEEELKYWDSTSDQFKAKINLYSVLPDDQHETMVRVALIAETKWLQDIANGLNDQEK